MKRRLPRRDLTQSRGVPGPGDGIDPRDERRAAARQGAGRPSRKALQLARQVAHTLDAALAMSRDPLVRDLQVESVVPAPDVTRFLVTVVSLRTLTPEDARRTLERLAEQNAELRLEVAGAISRRKTPQLAFQLAPAREAPATPSVGEALQPPE
jgi:ribosome-binding factor A